MNYHVRSLHHELTKPLNGTHMSMFQKLYHMSAGFACARIPQPVPPAERIAAAGIISHRGEHDNRQVLENTFAAFDAAVSAGVDGIEFDIRWTRDLHPVVFHDSDLQRLYGIGCRIADVEFDQLRSDFPLIPSLAELVERYGGRVHLMAEIKKEPYPEAGRQTETLRAIFSRLEPVRDYHFLSLDPEMFSFASFAPARAFLPVSEANVGKMSRLSLENDYGGILGHFYLIGSARIRRHKSRGQQVGTGYIASENCFFREVNRGVDWIFTENAVEICRIRSDLREAAAFQNRLPASALPFSSSTK